MKSSIVIISWWSNCLALRCIEQLKKNCTDRVIYVVQNGKSKERKELFSSLAGEDIKEINYPEDAPGEHYSVIEYVVKKALPDEDGLWFLDHDAFIQENADHFFDDIDRSVESINKCMFTPDRHPLTIPAFWLSPKRLPEDCPGFAPYPNKISKASCRPDMHEKEQCLEVPQYDTLVFAQQYLAEKNLSGFFPVSFFPAHNHLGGLHILLRSSEQLLEQAGKDEKFKEYMLARVSDLRSFFSSCHKNWLVSEENSILEKLDYITSSMLN